MTLIGAVTANQRRLVLSSTSGVRAGQILELDSEQVVVQHVGSGRVIRAARGAFGTARAPHSNGATVTAVDLGAGGGGGGSDVLTDPGNDWAPSTPVVQGYRIAETVQGALRVFEVSVAGTTDAGTAFTDYISADSLTPLAETITGTETWQYLGVVGELPWDIVPLPGIGLDPDGFHVATFSSISDASTMFRLLPALGEPDDVWEASTLIATAGYRIGVTVGDVLRVFEATALGTTGASEPTWLTASTGQGTTDGTVTWSYMGVVGGPDTQRPVFVVNSAGDADFFLDVNNGSGFRFNIAADGIPVAGSGRTEATTDGFNVAVASSGFHVLYDPFAIRMVGLPTSDPASAGQLWNSAGTLKVSAG